jgi:adenylate cyclase
MAQEIERKFLIKQDIWKKVNKPEGQYYRQGYLLNTKEKTVRVRIAGNQGYLTVKGATEGISRLEYEYPIPQADAEEMLRYFAPEGTEKIRYRLPAGNGLTWEVDEFMGRHQGLIIAEIELENEAQTFESPEWLGKEVTGDERYYNASLALQRFTPDYDNRNRQD